MALCGLWFGLVFRFSLVSFALGWPDFVYFLYSVGWCALGRLLGGRLGWTGPFCFFPTRSDVWFALRCSVLFGSVRFDSVRFRSVPCRSVCFDSVWFRLRFGFRCDWQSFLRDDQNSTWSLLPSVVVGGGSPLDLFRFLNEKRRFRYFFLDAGHPWLPLFCCYY